MQLDLSIIIPTFNERDNVKKIVELLNKTIGEQLQWEVIFVDDDSPDGTYTQVQALSKVWGNVRCLRRVGRRGLSSAVIEGMLSSSANFFMVMDGDGQHDEKIILEMFSTIKNQQLDLVVGSRFVGTGSTGELAQNRIKISKFATQLSRKIFNVKLSDPMSGFFMISRAFFENNVHQLSAIGFKILLDLIASANPPPTFVEVPYKMRKRTQGISKLEAIVIWEYLLLLLDKSIGRFIPLRFMMFIIVGLGGVLVHFAVFYSLSYFTDFVFLTKQSIAALVAMANNYTLNNVFTYRDKKLTGFNFFKGLFSFYLICSVGLLINVSLSNFLQDTGVYDWLAIFIGVVIGSVLNYGVTKYITWR